MAKNWYTRYPLFSAIATTVVAGVILIILDRCIINIRLWQVVKVVPAYLIYLLPIPLVVLVLLVSLVIISMALYTRECRKNRQRLVSSGDILWEYSDDLMTDDRGLEIEKAICPNIKCKNVLDMPEWRSNEAPVFGVRANCRKCGFSKDYPLYHLDGLKELAKDEVERLRRLKETPWEKVKRWVSSGAKSK